MRPATLATFALMLVLSPFAVAHQQDGAREAQPLVGAAKKANAGNPRRRAVRKTTPAGPTARGDAYQVLRGGTLAVGAEIGVLVNDTEPQSKPLSAILVTTTAHGALTLTANGGFTYVHDGSAGATDSFTYKASNGTAETNAATATITIADVPPVAVADAYPIGQDTLLTVPLPGVLANDTLNNGAIASYGAAGTEQTTIGNNTSTSQGGAVSVNANGAFSYSPAAGFTGADAFRYVLTNTGGSSFAQVALTVTPPPPVAVNDSASTRQGTQLNVAAPGVLSNDTLHGATIAGYGATTGVEQTNIGSSTPTSGGGSIRINANGSFRYDPAGSFIGNDTFKYVVTNAAGSATATVTITVDAADAVDFTVTSPGFFYVFTGVSGENPVLTLQRGRTYRFRINTAAAHPFEILNAPPGSISNNNISNGILIFSVPSTPDSYAYHCSIHDFGNSIQTTP
jgi:hypothetical protein